MICQRLKEGNCLVFVGLLQKTKANDVLKADKVNSADHVLRQNLVSNAQYLCVQLCNMCKAKLNEDAHEA